VLGKALEGTALVVVLWGLVYGIVAGIHEESLRSMRVELGALLAGLALFFLGRSLEKSGA
jgi:hypothetical protein